MNLYGDVVKKLIGPVYPRSCDLRNVGERYPNTQKLGKLAEDIVHELCVISRFSENHEESTKLVGTAAKTTLEDLKAMIKRELENEL